MLPTNLKCQHCFEENVTHQNQILLFLLKENYYLFHHYTFVVQIKKIADLSSNRTKPFERQIRIIKGMSVVLFDHYVTLCEWQNIFQSKTLS